MAELGERPVAPASPQGTYARKATGLVREVSPFSTFVFNMAGQPTAIFLAVSIFFTLGLFPGGSIWLGFALALVAAVIICVCYGLFASAIPRSGGDYVLVGRITHPVIGLISSFFWTSGVILSIAFVALAFVTVALGPSLTAVGLVSESSSLVNAGEDVAGSQGWQMGIGSALIVLSAILLGGGWRWTTRIMNGFWVVMMLGLGTVFLVLLFKSHDGFVNSFNQFAQTTTGEADTYGSVIANAKKEGVDTSPAFSLDNFWPTWAAICSLSLYSWLSLYISGEVRRAKDTTQMKVMSLAAVVHIAIAAILAAIFFWKFGHDFFVAINSLGESYPFAAPPYYTFLTSIAGSSTLLAWWLFLTFAIAYPLLILPNITIAVRTFFAWALDGMLPSRFARVSPRTHAPHNALVLTVVLSILVLWWAVSNNEGFLEVLFEAVLLQAITMILLGISAVLLPYRRPEIWRASATTQRVFGIPIVAIAGALVAVILAGIFYIYMHYPDLGVDKGHFFRDCGIILVASLLTFFVARGARKSQGVDVDKLAAEIPPE
ncbi:MAG TPA: APC family permease [Solirubrobacterales bacterium]|jgi:amino acid transporter|nr:APC family permease [Solirubrobacterales bacterium]